MMIYRAYEVKKIYFVRILCTDIWYDSAAASVLKISDVESVGTFAGEAVSTIFIFVALPIRESTFQRKNLPA